MLDLGFTSSSKKTSIIFANVIDQVFFGFGSTIQNGLITEAKKQILPKNFKFPYYSLVKQSINDFIGEVAGKKILEEINAELTRQTKIRGNIEDILSELSRREIDDQVKNFSGHEHVIYLWSNEDSRDQILKKFFEYSKGPKGAITPKEITSSEIKNVTYKEIFIDKTKAIENNTNALSAMHGGANEKGPSRIAGFDGTQWFSQGLSKEILTIERSAQSFISKNMISAICAYDARRIPDEETLKSFLNCHQKVLLDDPFVMYEKGV